MTRPRTFCLLTLLLLLGLLVSACGPRKHLHPKSGRYYRTMFRGQVRGAEEREALPSLGAQEGVAIHQRYLKAFRGKGAGGAVDGGGGMGGGMFTGGGLGGGGGLGAGTGSVTGLDE